MNIFNIISLFGGLAMFLYGMRMMGDGLKESSSGALKRVMERVTGTPFKAFLLGLVMTAVIQSSTATIVITSGLVGAGIISLHQSLGIIIGANVGTTVTGQIIRLLDLNARGRTSVLDFFKPSTLAPLALIIGIMLIMSKKGQDQDRPDRNGLRHTVHRPVEYDRRRQFLTETGIVEVLFSDWGESPDWLSGRSGGLLRAAELVGLHRYTAGILHIRYADLQCHLSGDDGHLPGRLRDHRYRLQHRRKARFQARGYGKHTV